MKNKDQIALLEEQVKAAVALTYIFEKERDTVRDELKEQRAGRKAFVVEATKILKEAQTERDEARSEVERLTDLVERSQDMVDELMESVLKIGLHDLDMQTELMKTKSELGYFKRLAGEEE